MQTSNKFNSIGKITAVLLAFVLLVTTGFAGLLKLYYGQFPKDCDLIFSGASTTYYGIDPNAVDAQMGTSSFNTASALTSLESRCSLISYMLDTQDVDTVVLDIAFDVLSFDMTDWPYEREIPVALKFDDPKIGIDYMCAHTDKWSDYELTFKNAAAAGLGVLINQVRGMEGDLKQYRGYEPANVEPLAGEGINPPENGEEGGIVTGCRPENLETLKRIADLCRERDVKLVLITVPLSENMLWRYTGWDAFREIMTEVAGELDCPYYDYNLLKGRQEILSDLTSFSDLSHLDAEGAEAFSTRLGQDLNRILAGEDLSDAFYGSYEEAEEHLIYAEN